MELLDFLKDNAWESEILDELEQFLDTDTLRDFFIHFVDSFELGEELKEKALELVDDAFNDENEKTDFLEDLENDELSTAEILDFIEENE